MRRERRERSLNPVTYGFQRLVYRRRGVVTRATLAYAGADTSDTLGVTQLCVQQPKIKR